jgi:hypothetical protein
MMFRDNESRIRKDYAPANFTPSNAYDLIAEHPEATAYASNVRHRLGRRAIEIRDDKTPSAA